MSVGNLPPGATVLIKITYVAELAVEGENIMFSLPGSVAPWKKEAALDETTQTDVEKVKVKEQRYSMCIHWMCKLLVHLHVYTQSNDQCLSFNYWVL